MFCALGFTPLAFHSIAVSVTPRETGWHPEAAVFVVAVICIAAGVGRLATISPSPLVTNGARAGELGLNSFESYSQLQEYVSANAKSAQQYKGWGIELGGLGPILLSKAVGGIGVD